MLAVLRRQHQGEQVRPASPAGDRMRRCWRLADRLARAAAHLLPHVLDHLPAPRLALERLGHVPAQLPDRATAVGAGARRGIDDPQADPTLEVWLVGIRADDLRLYDAIPLGIFGFTSDALESLSESEKLALNEQNKLMDGMFYVWGTTGEDWGYGVLEAAGTTASGMDYASLQQLFSQY